MVERRETRASKQKEIGMQTACAPRFRRTNSNTSYAQKVVNGETEGVWRDRGVSCLLKRRPLTQQLSLESVQVFRPQPLRLELVRASRHPLGSGRFFLLRHNLLGFQDPKIVAPHTPGSLRIGAW